MSPHAPRPRVFGAEVYAALKATTGQFVASAFGHQKVAAGATRVEQQAISSYASTHPDNAEKFMPADVVLDLCKASGNVALLRFMAEQVGCLLVQLPQGVSGDNVTVRSGRTAKEFGEVMSGVLAAVADGTITQAEARPILQNIHELMLELSALAEAVQAQAQDADDA